LILLSLKPQRLNETGEEEMTQFKALAASWARSSVAGMLAVYLTGNTNPKDLAMGLVAGIVPMLTRWANPNDVLGSKK
jgi:hypothetical protein